MERFHADVGAIESALQQRPEVLKAVGVNSTIHLFQSMIDHLISVIAIQTRVAKHYIGVELSTIVDALFVMGRTVLLRRSAMTWV
jgi:hypothetical protein